MEFETEQAEKAVNKVNSIAVTVISSIYNIALITLMIVFFVEIASLNDPWTNVGMMLISTFFAAPVVLLLIPCWIVLIGQREKRNLFPIINYTISLVLVITCVIIGWSYP